MKGKYFNLILITLILIPTLVWGLIYIFLIDKSYFSSDFFVITIIIYILIVLSIAIIIKYKQIRVKYNQNEFKNNNRNFKVYDPDIIIGKYLNYCLNQLKEKGISYKKIVDGYIIFEAKVTKKLIPLVIGLHYNLNTINYIEIFRPRSYFEKNDYSINTSFEEIQNALVEEYGNPNFNNSWKINGLNIEHYIIDRFGPEEHFHVYL